MRRISLTQIVAIALASTACVSINAPSSESPGSSAVPSASAPATPSPAASLTPTIATPPANTSSPTLPIATPTAQPTSAMAIAGRIVNAGQGYAITLPPSWLRLDLESGLSQFVAAAANADPSIAAQCDSSTQEELEACLEQEAAEVQAGFAALTEAGAQVAMDLATIGLPFPTFVLILTQPKTFGVTSDLLLATGSSSLRAVGVKGRIQSGLLDVPAGTAVYFYYAMPADGLANARARDFYLVAEDHIYEVLVVGHKSDDTMPGVADALIQSFEILP